MAMYSDLKKNSFIYEIGLKWISALFQIPISSLLIPVDCFLIRKCRSAAGTSMSCEWILILSLKFYCLSWFWILSHLPCRFLRTYSDSSRKDLIHLNLKGLTVIKDQLVKILWDSVLFFGSNGYDLMENLQLCSYLLFCRVEIVVSLNVCQRKLFDSIFVGGFSCS